MHDGLCMVESWNPPVQTLHEGPSERYAVVILRTRQHPLHTNESLHAELVWQLEHGHALQGWTIESLEVCENPYGSQFALGIKRAARSTLGTTSENASVSA